MYQNLVPFVDTTEHPREPKDFYERCMRADAQRRGGDVWFDDFSDNTCALCGPAAKRKLMTNGRTMETRCLDCWGFSETWVG